MGRANGAEGTSPGQRPGCRAESGHPPCRGGGSLRPCRARYIRLIRNPGRCPGLAPAGAFRAGGRGMTQFKFFQSRFSGWPAIRNLLRLSV